MFQARYMLGSIRLSQGYREYNNKNLGYKGSLLAIVL